MGGLTVHDLRALKGVRRISHVQVTREEEAQAAAEAGIDMIGTAFIPARAHFPKFAPDTHFQFGLPWGQHGDATEALRAAMAAMEAGAQTVYCAMSPAVVAVLAREGVPVIAHSGLVPPKMTWTGGYRAVGKTREQALRIWQDVRDFELAGAFAIELEVIPADLATAITQRTAMLTFSLGAGGGCDIECLFSADLLGDSPTRIPRHAKVYADLTAMRAQMQQERLRAYRAYRDDIRSGAFPGAAQVVAMPSDVLDDVVQQMDARKD